MRTTLFTGFPGFIGMRLLPRILELQPDSVVACLVQDKFLGQAKGGVEQLARSHPHTRDRIELLIGDITLPGLGIEASKAATLKRSLFQAWHLAAVYDLAVTREVGRRVNLEGTRNVLEFVSSAARFDRLQYVSTAYVSGTARGVFRETDLDVGQGFKNHYEETKFQAELEVVRSRVPATSYRPGVVVGDSRSGETGKLDGPYLVLRLMDQLPSPGVFFRVGTGSGTVNVVPIDFVVEAMARLAATPASLGRTYHLCDPQPHSPVELAEMFARALGRRFLFVPVPLGLARACLAPAAVQRVLGMPREVLDYFHDPVRHDTSQASRDLGALGVECPRLADYLPRLVDFYRSHRDAVRREAMS